MRTKSVGYRRQCLSAAVAVCSLLLSFAAAEAATPRRSVEQYGITWTFDREYPVGQFANGDYWVLGPVVIERIEPDFDGERHGWEVNPVVRGGQGFRKGPGFDPARVPALPYRAEETVSIVKTIANPAEDRVLLRRAAVLTVVAEIPPEDGRAVFRPPYVGNEKPLYRVADLRLDRLPALAPVEPRPDLAKIAQRYAALQMDHKGGALGRFLRPVENLADYQPKNTADQNEAALRLMLDDPIAAKMPALIAFVQFGLDKLHTIYLGQTWPDGGGHQPGHRLAPAFAAVLLDLEKGKRALREAEFFHGNRMFYRGRNGVVLWGTPDAERTYWGYIAGRGGNRSIRDPYGYIDGGKVTEGAYQVITSQSHKGEILATLLMPALREAWHPEEWAKVREYVDRWVTVGQWAQPDPVAPYDGNPDHYGVTYGPDPARPGEAIAGAGRFPEAHGRHRDGGQYRSAFVAAMWDAYRAAAEPRPAP